MTDNEVWVDMTDTQRWAYVQRLEKAVIEAVKGLGTLRQQRQRAIEVLTFIRDHEPTNDEGAAAFEQFAHDSKTRARQALNHLGGQSG